MKWLKQIIPIMAMIMAIMAVSYPAEAGDLEKLGVDGFKKVAQGGLLYDNWSKVTEINTEDTHPSYPAEGEKSGASTWRCKECHGWDYNGKDGAYAGGSHYTGIKGIRAYAGRTPKEVLDVLKDETHSPGNLIPERSLVEIAFFVAFGQIDMDAYIDLKTNKVSGDITNGAKIYSVACAKCHGNDGKKINFKTDEKPEYMGTLANKNPWETLHKLRFGQPAMTMPGLLYLDVKDQVDVLSYTQTLPVK